MFSSIRQILTLFSPAERHRFVWVMAAMLTMGVLQLAGVGVILPFVALLSNPSHIQDSALLHWLYEFLGFGARSDFLIFVGTILLIVLVASNLFTAFTFWLMTHFAWGVQKRISGRLLSGYLHQPYESFLNRNSADIGKNILFESQQFTNGVLMPALQASAFGFTVVLIIGFLIWLNPVLALSVTAIFGIAYLLVYITVRRSLLHIGKQRMTANTARFKAVGEAFGSIKEVKVLGREDAFLKRYEPAASMFATANAKNQVFGQLPRYIIESLAFGMIMLVLLYLLSVGGDVKSALPVASAFVVGGYRLLPALQQVYQGFAKWRFNQSVADTLHRDLAASRPGAQESSRPYAHDARAGPKQSDPPQKLSFAKAIELTGVSYRYPHAPEASLDNITLTIPHNSFVAFSGSTGAGKTTLADLVLGLLEPSEGQLSVDGVVVTGANRRRWQANLGYVPQDIFLTDNTVTGNIAYGVDENAVDSKAVTRAARIANIHDFILDKLPNGYDTMVGERGVRLSGGQRQRIGIARALYHDPQVIVLDEATSALDNETERRIVDELDAMRGGRTLIVIAHRLTTVQKCSTVFLLENGTLAASGSYQDLIDSNDSFRRLAQTQS